MRWRIKQCVAALICLFGTAQLAAQSVTLCAGQIVPIARDGRVLGHIPYDQVPRADLVSAPPGFALGQPCLMHRDAAPDLARLIRAAADTPGVGRTLHGISCYRSVEHQRAVFCSQIGPRKRCKDAAERARVVGPPGHSEHSTGYALDFAVRPSPGCPDVDDCIAKTPAGAWLLEHAPEYGFELSFPPGNAQGVTWEPWHWRWVGRSPFAPGAGLARALFARARVDFPATPAVIDQQPVRVITDPGSALPAPIDVPPLNVRIRKR